MPVRRLEDRIRELCARVIYESGEEWKMTVHKLQSAIQEHMLRMSNTASAATVAGKPELIRERRTGFVAKTADFLPPKEDRPE